MYKIDESSLINLLSKNVTLKFSNPSNKTVYNQDILDEMMGTTDGSSRRRLSIEGTDWRTQVSSSYSGYTPYKEMGQVAYYADGQWNYCSGTLIGPKHVLTQAGCLHGGGDIYLDGALEYDGDWYSSVYFCPSRVSSSCSKGWYSMESAYVPNGWIEDWDSDYNYGLLVLSSSPNVGYYRFGYSTSITTSTYFYSIGYPSDKSSGTMWWTSCYMRYVGSNYMIDSSCDYYSGQWGSGTYIWSSGTPIVYGLGYEDVAVSCSTTDTCTTGFCFCYDNQHIRFTSLSYEEICSWIDDATVC